MNDLSNIPVPATPATLIQRAQALGREFAASAPKRDLERILPHAEIAALRDSGILAARLPAPWGSGALYSELSTILTEIARGDVNIAQAISPHLALIEKLILFGNAEDQARLYPLIAQGALITNAVAEAGGKFVGELRVTLSDDGIGGYILNGRKDYATGSLFAQYLYITGVRSDGSTLQVVVPRDRAGLTINDDWDGFGQRLTASGSVLLDNVAVAADEVLHGSQNAGQRNYFGASSQLHHAALDSGIALAALDDAIRLATKARPVPEAKVERASEDPHVIHSVGELATIARAAIALTERAALVLDRTIAAYAEGRATDDLLAETSITVAEAKAVASEACLKAAEIMFRVGGASSTLRHLGLDRHWRNARTHTLHDPVAWKYRAIGNYLLNGVKPPINAKY